MCPMLQWVWNVSGHGLLILWGNLKFKACDHTWNVISLPKSQLTAQIIEWMFASNLEVGEKSASAYHTMAYASVI